MTTPGLPAMPVSSTPAVPSAGFRFTKEHLVVAVPVAVVAAVGGFLVSHYLSSGRSCKKGQFPYCDGAHAKHNDATGDNVGPLIIKKKDA
ncbi:hypothetical protein JOB18_047601 [Solea senegalensis]|uniref:Iron-binding zinc finger CDGSH type domain-containing protein n=1 Tax=Solea senegalensis TaxID=28829 RepID=A0AAV6SMM2_SOLSE|nr:hypothetical protein JOB18_047601 [Solea senegalensis]